MTVWQALKQLVLDIPNIAVAVVAALSAWLLANEAGADPDFTETVWFGLCVAGFHYHWEGVREIQADRQALISWKEADEVDLESTSDGLRQERIRLVVKGLFSAAGLISLFVPPRAVPQYEITTQVIIILLIGAVLALDVDAVLKRRSRRRQLDLLTMAIEERRQRRIDQEQEFRPEFEQFASASSARGRELAHDIKGQVAIIVASIEALKQSSSCSTGDHEMMDAADTAADQTVRMVDQMHTLVRDLEVTSRRLIDGPYDSAGSVQSADES